VRPEGILYVDGAALGNPGEGGYGVILRDSGGRVLFFCAGYLGTVTNNQAEYMALIRGLEEAKRRGFEAVKVFTDSELVARQVTGRYRVRDEGLKPLHARVMELLKDFSSWEVQHIPREMNREADFLAKRAAEGKVWDGRR